MEEQDVSGDLYQRKQDWKKEHRIILSIIKVIVNGLVAAIVSIATIMIGGGINIITGFIAAILIACIILFNLYLLEESYEQRARCTYHKRN